MNTSVRSLHKHLNTQTIAFSAMSALLDTRRPRLERAPLEIGLGVLGQQVGCGTIKRERRVNVPLRFLARSWSFGGTAIKEQDSRASSSSGRGRRERQGLGRCTRTPHTEMDQDQGDPDSGYMK